MSDINLLKPSAVSTGGNTRGLLRVVMIILVVLLVLVVGFYGYLFFQSSSIAKQKAEMQRQLVEVQNSAMANKQRNEVLARQGQLKELNSLVDNHKYWSLLLPELARVTLKSAKYTSIKAQDDGKVNLAVSVSSYAELDKFMQIFDLNGYNSQFSNVKVISVRKAQEGDKVMLGADIELTFNTDFIKSKN